MPIWDRDWFRGKHPPTCTCAECVKKRLAEEFDADTTQHQRNFPQNIDKPVQKTEGKNLVAILSLLLIFSLSLIGIAANIFCHTFIPLCILSGFSVFYSIEKWFVYYTRKYIYIGRTYRLFLNLSTLSLLGIMIWSGIQLFSQRFSINPVVGSIVFVLEIIFFIWLCKVVAQNSWRKPSMKLTVFALIVLFFILAFAGVQPITSYKDKALNLLGNIVSLTSSSSGPAKITAKVTIVDGIRTENNGESVYVKVSDDANTSWIVDISVTNNAYQNAIRSNFALTTEGKTYTPKGFVYYTPPTLNVSPGQTGNTILRFYVPRTLSISDTKIVYQGEEPYSSSTLSGSNFVIDIYDISTKSKIVTSSLLEVADIWGIDLGLFGCGIFVQLESTPSTIIGKYNITLYSGKENFGTKTIYWSEGQEIVKIEWDLDPTARPLAELARGKTCKQVFQVEIKFNPY